MDIDRLKRRQKAAKSSSGVHDMSLSNWMSRASRIGPRFDRQTGRRGRRMTKIDHDFIWTYTGESHEKRMNNLQVYTKLHRTPGSNYLCSYVNITRRKDVRTPSRFVSVSEHTSRSPVAVGLPAGLSSHVQPSTRSG